MKNNKKANVIAEGTTILVVLFVLGIITTTGFMIFGEVNDEIQASDDMSNESKEIADDLHTQYPTLFDGIFIFLLVGFWIAAIIFSFLVDTHPIFLVISLILIVFILAIAAYMTNTYEDITGSGDLAASSNNFPMTNFIIGHLVETILIITISVVISLFAKSRI